MKWKENYDFHGLQFEKLYVHLVNALPPKYFVDIFLLFGCVPHQVGTSRGLNSSFHSNWN